ncbi:MAG: recombinase family protein [Patescibacteria group bacterium]|jgi:site-specific DNA recombinase
MEKLRAVIYIRVSDESQIKNNSLETQLKACHNYADLNSLEVVKVFREEGVSAKHIHTRPEMRSLLQFCTLKKNCISQVIVYKMDRWTRNVEEGLAAISLLSRSGVAVSPATEVADQGSMGKAMRTILMALGELDNGLKSEWVRDNMQTMFRKGLWPWKPQIGYLRPKGDRDQIKGKPAIRDERYSEMIRLLFSKASGGQYSKLWLAKYLNSLGFSKTYGRPADGKLITHIIKNPFYYGMMYAPRWREYQRGVHDPIVDQITWEKANMNTFKNKRTYNTQDSVLYPLKGLLACSNCMHTLTSSNPFGRAKNYLYYECHNKACTKKERIGADVAQEQFLSILSTLKPSKRVLKMFVYLVFEEWDETIAVTRKEATLREEKIKQLEAEIITTNQGNAKGMLTDDEALSHIEDIRREIAVLSVERAEMKIDEYSTETVKNFTETFLANLDRFWLQLDLPEKQMLQAHVFPAGLLCENKEIRINGLARSFELIEAMKDDNFQNVTPRGIEPRLYG